MRMTIVLIFLVILSFSSHFAHADCDQCVGIKEGQRQYQVDPGSSTVRYDKPSRKMEGGRIYEVQPGTNNIRYDKPSYKEINGRLYQVNPGSSTVRYDKPSYKVK